MPDIPSYIATLVRQTTSKATEKKLWNIGMSTTWLPFFTATNLMGATFLPAEAMGCPVRLAVGKDGVVKMGADGRPKTVVCKEIKGAVVAVQQNFLANLHNFTADTVKAHGDEYAELVASYQRAGQPIAEKQNELAIKATMEYAEKQNEQESAPAERELAGVT